ncbi:MAG: hypothetical protein Hyperionvirus34_27 [Hyperionvirus sp.]|uniref:Uncharacterized protein n=1 Tax=Hyperionvirus sp. TaxID=2487770 RepID=A0A3G5AFP1_9VIRU|nr:MAG: hypothetical protein Hyperionvirus34_27 [Hyperionvirus sp.]
MAAAEVKANIPSLTEVTVPRVLSLIDRLSESKFHINALTDAELHLLIHEIASLRPYHRGIIEQLLTLRIEADPKYEEIWRRLQTSKDGTTLAFYAECFTIRVYTEMALKDKARNRTQAYTEAYELGERYYSPVAIATSMPIFQTKPWLYPSDAKSKDPSQIEMLKLLNESVSAGNPFAHMLLIHCFASKLDDPDGTTVMNLFAKRLLLGPCFTAFPSDDYPIGDIYFYSITNNIKTLTDAVKVLECAANVYIGVEHQLQSKQLDRVYYEKEQTYGGGYTSEPRPWKQKELTDHTKFLTRTLEKIIEEFGKDALKIITPYYTILNNNVLTAQILFFLATTELKVGGSPTHIIEPFLEAFEMVRKSHSIGNLSAHKFLTSSDPSSQRQIQMCAIYQADIPLK